MQRKIILMASMALLISCLAILAQAQNDYTTFRDPNGMFTMDVPQGWTTNGGTYTDQQSGISCYYVSTVSPDSSVVINLGDPGVSAVIPQQTGKQYAEWYYQNRVANQLQGTQVLADSDYGNNAGYLGYAYGNFGGIIGAQTMPKGDGNYGISLLFHIIAPQNQLQQALDVAAHMIQSTRSTSQQTYAQGAYNPGPGNYASNLNIDNQNYALGIIDSVMENQDNMWQHATNERVSNIRDEPGGDYQWQDSSGNYYTTPGLEKPTDDAELEY